MRVGSVDLFARLDAALEAMSAAEGPVPDHAAVDPGPAQSKPAHVAPHPPSGVLEQQVAPAPPEDPTLAYLCRWATQYLDPDWPGEAFYLRPGEHVPDPVRWREELYRRIAASYRPGSAPAEALKNDLLALAEHSEETHLDSLPSPAPMEASPRA